MTTQSGAAALFRASHLNIKLPVKAASTTETVNRHRPRGFTQLAREVFRRDARRTFGWKRLCSASSPSPQPGRLRP